MEGLSGNKRVVNAIDRLLSRIDECENPSVIGLDTDFEYLPDNMRAGVTSFSEAADRVLAFNKKIIDNIYDIVPAVKVQVAYYEMLGFEGMRAFFETLSYAKEKGMVVIADCKRNDIGSTMDAYATAYLGKTTINDKELKAFPCDFLTVNGYLGTDGISPLISRCKEFGKGLFVLVKTSNPSSSELQDLVLEDGKKVYERMAESVSAWGAELVGESGYSSIGAVVGATHPQQASELRDRFPKMFFLVPGYGVQGGGAQGVLGCFDARGKGAIINNSRGILLAYRKDYPKESYYAAARLKCLEMRGDIQSALSARKNRV